ncbi:energy transducer TonB [uncultured Croceicoccus sp.]|uniref:energy transducer TonB n=1 Tax=uncultured Croceicoccus sp. TaxID=1295329 RepID=UPI0026374F87|nr:energy transducer TonB [uncultured Croceicoccus sp.]
MRRSLAIAAAASIASAQPAAARDPLVLRPTEPWTMNYGEDSCQLVRIFGEGEDETGLMIEQFGPSERVRITLISRYAQLRVRPYPHYAIDQKTARSVSPPQIGVRFGKTGEAMGEAMEARVKSASMADGRFITVASAVRPTLQGPEKEKEQDEPYHLPALSIDALAGSDRVAFEGLVDGDLILATGPLAAATKAMNACSENLLSHWGLDIAAHRTLRSPVRMVDETAPWLNYPDQQNLDRIEGLVEYRVMVDSAGLATACHIQSGSGPDTDFGDAVCHGMMNTVVFEPAINAGGEPIASYYRGTVDFRFR